uniref:Uncharacterized protein n=1 Tax=Arundo donax TaxID=35708 RepID=A0A0A8Z137_ARUDO
MKNKKNHFQPENHFPQRITSKEALTNRPSFSYGILRLMEEGTRESKDGELHCCPVEHERRSGLVSPKDKLACVHCLVVSRPLDVVESRVELPLASTGVVLDSSDHPVAATVLYGDHAERPRVVAMALQQTFGKAGVGEGTILRKPYGFAAGHQVVYGAAFSTGEEEEPAAVAVQEAPVGMALEAGEVEVAPAHEFGESAVGSGLNPRAGKRARRQRARGGRRARAEAAICGGRGTRGGTPGRRRPRASAWRRARRGRGRPAMGGGAGSPPWLRGRRRGRGRWRGCHG